MHPLGKKKLQLKCILCRNKKKHEKGLSKDKLRIALRVEKEFLKPAYAASIGGGLEDGLFDGNICAFPCCFW